VILRGKAATARASGRPDIGGTRTERPPAQMTVPTMQHRVAAASGGREDPRRVRGAAYDRRSRRPGKRHRDLLAGARGACALLVVWHARSRCGAEGSASGRDTVRRDLRGAMTRQEQGAGDLMLSSTLQPAELARPSTDSRGGRGRWW
jgi:hypothetical protein